MKIDINLPDNCTLIFSEKGIAMRVTLNIPRDLVEYIPKFYLDRGKKFNTFILRSNITDCTYEGIHSMYNSMVGRAMLLIRYYKLSKLLREIKNVNH